MLHSKTKLIFKEKQMFQKMMYKFITYTKKGDFSSESHLAFCKNILEMDFRLGQHLIETLFYKYKYNLYQIKSIMNNDIILSNQPDTSYVDNSYIVAAIHGEFMKKTKFFSEGILTVLEPPQTEKNINLQPALRDTGQKFPDYFYMHKNKGITRHFDLKTTPPESFKYNNGHVLSVSDDALFDIYTEKILTLQGTLYGKKYPEINNFFLKLFETQDSWLIRNEKVHEFYLNILHKYPNIRPSLIFKHELSYESKTINVPKHIETIMSYYDIAESRQASEKAFAKALFNSGKPTVNKFMEAPQHNQNIKKILKEMLNDWIQNNND